MSDLIRRQDALDAFGLTEKSRKYGGDHSGYDTRMLYEIMDVLESLPSTEPEQRWIPVTEALPENKEWYLGIFKESDTGYCISVPFVCYYAGRKTMITTKDYWILRGYDDIYSFSEYYRNLECVAWMPLPEPWRGE